MSRMNNVLAHYVHVIAEKTVTKMLINWLLCLDILMNFKCTTTGITVSLSYYFDMHMFQDRLMNLMNEY